MKKKVTIPVKDSHRLVNAGALALISASYEGSSTITPIAWHMPVSSNPKLFAAAFAHKRYSLELALASGCFCINIPGASLKEQVLICGKNSGRDMDKFKETGLTAVKCNKIPSLYVSECIAHIECSVTETFSAGDHTIVIGMAVDAYSDESLLTDKGIIDIENFEPLHHLGGVHFAALKKI